MFNEMKKQLLIIPFILFLFSLGIFLNSCISHNITSIKSKNDSAVFRFVSTTKNFGYIKEGFVSNYTFEFENTGNANLLIDTVETECNCTVADYSTNSIMPNDKGFIKVIFKSSGNLGSFNKTITVFSNATEKQKVLNIKGVVISSGK